MQKVLQRRTRSNCSKLRAVRKKLKKEINNAKNDWLRKQCLNLNCFGTKQAWDSIKNLKGTLTKVKSSSTKPMKKSDGTVCSTPEENAEVFHLHFQSLYDREGTYDPSVVDELSQYEVHNGLDHTPTDKEIRTAILKLKDKAPGESGIVPRVFKCIIDCQETYSIFKTILLDIWHTEQIPEEWNLGRLIVLPKKGDLSQPKNYRGIMLLEIAYKVLAIIIQDRLSPIVEQLDHEQQCGFRPNRGCVDAIFTIKSALRKRREHGLESWVLFLDLVKAFDRVPRKLLWEILIKFGVPMKLVSLLKALHNDFNVKFSIDGVDKSIKNTIGVKQGDILGPILFVFFICAVMITWRAKLNINPCIFRSKNDDKMTGRRYTARGEEFPLLDSEYADDTAVLFDNRNHLVEGIVSIVEHFDRFGTEIHTGVLEPRENSKTEVLFCSKPSSFYNTPDTFDDADLSDIILNDRYIPIVKQFCYLGSIISSDCSDIKDVEARIRKASNAFGALRKSVFGSKIVRDNIKGEVYETCILPILLYGAESWCITELIARKLRNFHHQCIRAMCAVNRFRTWNEHISTASLLEKVSIKNLDSYLFKCQLRWVGHVVRMPWERLPRKMLTCWVRSKRPRGCPKFTFGRSIKKALNFAKIDFDNWFEIANDRTEWRSAINRI